MNKKKINEIIKIFKKKNPIPKTELNYKTPFELLIALILSAKSKDIQVNKITKKLWNTTNTPKKILKLGKKKLKKQIKSLGLFNNKTKNIIKTCEIIINKHKNKIPNNRKELEKLPGIGRKSSNIILNILYNKNTIAVDTHVFRICNRTKIVTGNTTIKIEKKLIKIIPKKFKKNIHNWLVLHGRYICKAKKPLCNSCKISKLCEYKSKNYF
ncbi:endonuclease III [Candidatus Purcelliella pentastirinorum]|nr:endonuclease III [Candidatus Purcelliella pentastirinorum]WDR80225.1 endonuclease III [Candidatus Purcelliella pentastirinorum]